MLTYIIVFVVGLVVGDLISDLGWLFYLKHVIKYQPQFNLSFLNKLYNLL